MKRLRWLIRIALAVMSAPALAGPPYQTDDPEPTDFGRWEIYDFVTADGRAGEVDGALGLDVNYGAARGLQLTATLPVAFARNPEAGWQTGRGDLELGAKYRFFNDESDGWQAAIFPRVILPTAVLDLGGTRARFLLPLWIQKDLGKTSVFGGGGFEINPGRDNKNFWLAGLAVTQDLGETTSLGIEISWQSSDTRDGKDSTGVNVGLIQKLGGPFALLLSGGPSFSGGRASYHSYAALSLNF